MQASRTCRRITCPHLFARLRPLKMLPRRHGSPPAGETQHLLLCLRAFTALRVQFFYHLTGPVFLFPVSSENELQSQLHDPRIPGAVHITITQIVLIATARLPRRCRTATPGTDGLPLGVVERVKGLPAELDG